MIDKQPSIAIVHERLTEVAGSEHVVEQLAVRWPTASVYVPFANPEAVVPVLRGRVHTTGLDRLHRAIGRRSYAPILPLVPMALRRLDFGDVDAVVISHHALALSAVHATEVPTVAYVHSPARWAWDRQMRAGEASGMAGKSALAALAAVARRTESGAAPRVTSVVANSTEVAARIKRWWNRDSVVVHPPVDTDRYTPDTTVEREDFFLLAGRLVPYKRPDIAVRAAAQAGVRLVVAGDGRQADLCRSIAAPDTEFLGRVSDDDMLSLQRRARALVMPGVEDFGIVPVEAMACGTPVIAVGAGGACDTVVEGLSGELVRVGADPALVDGFARAMATFDSSYYSSADIRTHAEKFSRVAFRESMAQVVADVCR
ncbi:glycosyltransferase [Williamsia phyllosphaerae]|uniref:Glycosyl transferase n=1 Tax=Williamsia phyllosphaerae TaxID=885042 RepID=A0ABQ1U8L0_9NOCA|nr:glycosyltransferase [Williamsia phyllosphaerae]GGF12777.1 putative glycosyl transferase [Williamsia phyllosphaerae]